MDEFELLKSNFLNHKMIEEKIAESQTMCTWDFNTALGNTIREKYESLYVKLVEITNVMLRKGAKGYFWIVSSPEVASIFETANYSFHPVGSLYDSQMPMGGSEIYEIGVLDHRWRLYVDHNIEQNVVLVGVGMEKSQNAVLKITNFVI